MPELLSYQEEGPVLVVRLERPESGNVLSRQLQGELLSAWEHLESEDRLLAAVVHGGENVFSVGHDVPELLSAADNPSMAVPVEGMFPHILSKPVIAAVEGGCYGLGFELALACDLRIAGEDAQFGFPDTNLPVGLELLLTGELMDAQKMLQIRLVSRVTPTGEALAQAVETVQDMARRFGAADAFRKQQLWQFSGLPPVTAMNMARSAVTA